MTFTLDIQVAAVLAAAFERGGPPPAPPVGDVASRRVALDAMLGYFNNEAQPVADKVDISDHSVVTPDGAALLARWYRQPSGDSRAAVLYLHGGGMIAGSVAIFDGPVSRYVARTGVSMLSLKYRLAPEHPHPTPVEDAYAGLVWLVGHAAELGIDPGRIAVMGDSAGGGLAAGIAILSRARKGPAVAGQLDIFRDEGVRYALTLSRAGVPVELHLHPGVPHEYDAIAFDADVSRRAQSDRDRVLRSL